MSCGIVWMIKKITKKGGPHLNICLGAPESPVTPLSVSCSDNDHDPALVVLDPNCTVQIQDAYEGVLWRNSRRVNSCHFAQNNVESGVRIRHTTNE